MTSYVEAETWACSDPKTTFVIKRMGNKFKVMTGKDGSNFYDIVSENINNLVLLRNLNEEYMVMIMNKQTKMLSYIKSIEDIRDNYVLDVNTIYPISNTIRNPFPQIGLVAK